MDTDDVAVGEGEARCAEHEHGRGIEPGSAAARLAEPQPVGEVVTLGCALSLVPTGEVEDLGEVVRQWQYDLEPVEGVRTRTGVGELVATSQAATGERLELEDQAEAGVVVACGQSQRGLVGREVLGPEARRPVATTAVAAEVRPGERVVGVLTEQSHRARGDVDSVLVVTGGQHAGPVDEGQPVVGRVDPDPRAQVPGGWEEHR